MRCNYLTGDYAVFNERDEIVTTRAGLPESDANLYAASYNAATGTKWYRAGLIRRP